MCYVVLQSQFRNNRTSDISECDRPSCSQCQQQYLNKVVQCSCIFFNKTFMPSLHYISIYIYIYIGLKFTPTISDDMGSHVFISLSELYFRFFLFMYLSYISFLLVCVNLPLTPKTGRFWNPL